jgi:AraC-like DNA-binding protein
LIRSLARHLPKIGITTAAVFLYEDEKISVCVGSFAPEGISPVREQRFSSRLLVPARLAGQYADGIFLVQPLFIENQSLGYFIHNVPFHDGIIFEELRSAISYALKGISLLEEVIRAKRITEQAERAKTEFLLSLENSLYDPLSGMMHKIEAVEKKLPPGSMNTGLTELKSFVSSREEEVGSLIDLALTRLDDLALQKTLFDPDELLPGIGDFPLLTGDVSRLSQCFSLIREEYGGGISARMQYGGLEIAFRAVPEAPAADKKNNLLLAERIILMHGGEWRRDDRICTLTLPWTTLTGQEPARQPVGGPQDHVLVLSDPALLPANFFTLPMVHDIEKMNSLPGRIAFIVWNSDSAPMEDFVKIAALRHRSDLFAIPFLCYGKGLVPAGANAAGKSPAEKTLIQGIERMIRFPQKGPILFVGTVPVQQALADCGEVLHIPSMAVFNETVGELSPSLIVLNSINPEAAETIRRHPLTVMVPIVMLFDRIESAVSIQTISRHSRLILCHSAVAASPEFSGRIKALLGGGDEILPPYTGALVKKTQSYFDEYAESHISRWKLAESVHVSEDYLTRIFHRELGLSPWDYLNRLRVSLAADLLRQTDETIQAIALRTGFQDQAYFCRVFRKIYGIPPGKLRKQ